MYILHLFFIRLVFENKMYVFENEIYVFSKGHFGN